MRFRIHYETAYLVQATHFAIWSGFVALISVTTASGSDPCYTRYSSSASGRFGTNAIWFVPVVIIAKLYKSLVIIPLYWAPFVAYYIHHSSHNSSWKRRRDRFLSLHKLHLELFRCLRLPFCRLGAIFCSDPYFGGDPSCCFDTASMSCNSCVAQNSCNDRTLCFDR